METITDWHATASDKGSIRVVGSHVSGPIAIYAERIELRENGLVAVATHAQTYLLK